MRSMRTNGASKNPDSSCFFSPSKLLSIGIIFDTYGMYTYDMYAYGIFTYSHLSNNRGGWNKRVGVQKLQNQLDFFHQISC